MKISNATIKLWEQTATEIKEFIHKKADDNEFPEGMTKDLKYVADILEKHMISALEEYNDES